MIKPMRKPWTMLVGALGDTGPGIYEPGRERGKSKRVTLPSHDDSLPKAKKMKASKKKK